MGIYPILVMGRGDNSGNNRCDIYQETFENMIIA